MSELKSVETVTEAPAKRTVEQINAEYSQVCTQLGDLTVKRANLDRAILALHSRVAELDKEMKEVTAEQKAE